MQVQFFPSHRLFTTLPAAQTSEHPSPLPLKVRQAAGGVRCLLTPVSSAHGLQHLLRRSGTASEGRRGANREAIHAMLDGPESHLFGV